MIYREYDKERDRYIKVERGFLPKGGNLRIELDELLLGGHEALQQLVRVRAHIVVTNLNKLDVRIGQNCFRVDLNILFHRSFI